MVFGLCCRTPFKFIGLLLTPLLAERESQLDLVGALMCIFESGVRVAKAYKGIFNELGI